MKNRIIKNVLAMLAIGVLSVTISSYTFAADNKNIEAIKAKDILEDIAGQSIKLMTIKKCIPSQVKGYKDSGSKAGKRQEILNRGDLKRVGLWMEEEVTGDAGDGLIYCDESMDVDKHGIIQLAAKMFDTNWAGILCNKYNQQYPGVLNLVADGDNKSGNCQRFGSNGGAHGRYFDADRISGLNPIHLDPSDSNSDTYSNGSEYIRRLYYDWARKKGYIDYVDYYDDVYADTDEMQLYPKYTQYYSAVKDFARQCSSKALPSDLANDSAFKLKAVTDKGVTKTLLYEDQGWEDDEDSLWYEQNVTCQQLINRANAKYSEWRDKLKDIYKGECDKSDDAKTIWKFEYRRANFIANGDPNEAVIITPDYQVAASSFSFKNEDGSGGGYSKSEYEAWKKKGLVWQNYTETKDEEGNTVYKTIELTEDDKSTANTVISEYNKYKKAGTYFEDQGEDKGFVCHVPEGYTYSEVPQDDGSSSDTSGEVEATCQNSGGAGSLGWIVCPILDWMQEASTHIYQDYVEPSLVLETELFKDGNGTDQAWSTFQGFANVCFIILFLAIIFSQLTGVGIDNYGIKKLLPKLIVVAIMVNLSYLICVICADLSNIIGNALNTMFDGLAAGSLTVGGKEVGNGAGATAITAVALVAGVFALGVTVWKNPAILLTLLVGALGVLIGIFFLFILLAARKAAIVVLTAISPLAFVCYMLPNTKKLFDRWLKFWEAMLLLYPICGLLVGGGNFASRLMLTVLSNNQGDDFFGYFSAMMIGIIPIFFIPTVLKSAFAAFGSIGSKISGFGDRMRSGATRGIRNSERFKNAQDRSQARQKRLSAQRRAGVYIDKDGNVKERRRPSARIRRGIAGTRVGKAFGMDRTIGQNTTSYLQQEAARRDDIEGMDLDSANATFAGVAAKAKAQRVSDQETLIAKGEIRLGEDTEIQGKNGKVKINAGTAINANNVDSLAAYHASMLKRASAAKAAGNDAEYNNAMDRVKAAQNLLSKTDSGRGHVQSNLEAAVAANQTGGLADAAGHLLDNHGDKYKSVNRGAHAMISDLATKSINDVQAKLTGGEYAKAGVNKYTEESLAGADEAALQKLVGSMGSMSQKEKDTIAETAYKALNNSNIHTQPAVKEKLETLAAGYTPPAEAPQMISHGAYEDKNGNVYHLREMNNGKYLDDSGFEVDITHFKKR